MARSATPSETSTIRVNLGTIGGTVKTVLLAPDATVRDALAAGEYPTDSEVRCNGSVYQGDDQLDDEDTLIVLAGAKVKGAR